MREQMICWVTCVLGLLVVSTGCVDRDLGVLEPRVGRAIDMPVNSVMQPYSNKPAILRVIFFTIMFLLLDVPLVLPA